MWSALLVVTLLMAIIPVRLALILLLISRPRPVQNLLAFWAGCVLEGIPILVVPLIVLHGTPMFEDFADGLATSSAFRHVQIGIGVFSLSIAALIALHSLTRRRERVKVPVSAGAVTTTATNPERTAGISRFLNPSPDATEPVSGAKRLLRRAQISWENGSLWVAFVIGLMSGPAIDEAAYVLAIIVASGASMVVQIITAIAVVFGILAVVEIALISYAVAPAKTQAVLERVHDWALKHRAKILIAMCTIAGTSMLIHGMTGI